MEAFHNEFGSGIRERLDFESMHKLFEIKNKLSQTSSRDNHQPRDGTLWELTSFPGVEYPESYYVSPDWWSAYEELCLLVKSNVQEYPNDIEEVVPKLDVLSYLSRSGGKLIRRNGDRVTLNEETFRGKYVWVCCFHVPFLYYGSDTFIPLINLCHELYSSRSDEFEMVVVARMNGVADTRDVFDYFFSGFPESCLAVPFKDDGKRDYICKVLGLGSDIISYVSLFLNEKQEVLENFLEYGANAFPFTEAVSYKLRVQCSRIKYNKVELEEVLKCDERSPPLYVRNFNSSVNMPITKLGGKHVGLYLCWKGSLAPHLSKMYVQCREEAGLEFEVVVIYMPYYSSFADPKRIEDWLQKCDISGWWFLPFNYSISCWLAILTEHYEINGEILEEIDKLIVVGPKVDRLDWYGDIVMKHQGIDAFPFTREAGIKNAKERLLKMRLESLFVDGVTFFRGENRKDTKTLPQLVHGGKKIVVLIDLLYKYHEYGEDWDWEWEFGRLARVYNQLGRGRGFEIVFVEVGSEDKVVDEVRQGYLAKMPWYVCPRDKTEYSAAEELSTWFSRVWDEKNLRDAVIGFGEDGQLCSYNFKWMLPIDGHDVASAGVEQIFFTPLDQDLGILTGYDGLGS